MYVYGLVLLVVPVFGWKFDVPRLRNSPLSNPGAFLVYEQQLERCTWEVFSSLASVTTKFKQNLADLTSLSFFNPSAGYYSPKAGPSISFDPMARYISNVSVQVCTLDTTPTGKAASTMLTVSRVGPILLAPDTAFDISFLPAAPPSHTPVFLVEWFDGVRTPSGALATYPPIWIHHSQSLQNGVDLPPELDEFVPLTAMNNSVRFRGFQKPSNAADFICESEEHPLYCGFKRMPPGMGIRKGLFSDIWSQGRFQNVGQYPLEVTLEYARRWAIPRKEKITQLLYAYFSVSTPLGSEYVVRPFYESLAWRTFSFPAAGFVIGTALHTHAQQAHSETWVLNTSAARILPSVLSVHEREFSERMPSVLLREYNLSITSVKQIILARSAISLRTIFNSKRVKIDSSWYIRGADRTDMKSSRRWSFTREDFITLVAFVDANQAPAHLHNIVGAFLHFDEHL